MSETAPGEVTRLLNRLQRGDKHAEGELITCVYHELKTLAAVYMRRERSDHTLQPTALVNEAYLRLTGQKTVTWQNRAHFFEDGHVAEPGAFLRGGSPSDAARPGRLRSESEGTEKSRRGGCDFA